MGGENTSSNLSSGSADLAPRMVPDWQKHKVIIIGASFGGRMIASTLLK